MAQKSAAFTVLRAYQMLLSMEVSEVQSMGTVVPFATFDTEVLLQLCEEVIPFLQRDPNVLRLPAPVIIVGDLHGNLRDLIRVLIRGGQPPDKTYLFLGDYVDRGEFSVEVISLLLALKAQYPDSIYLLRGNHEFAHINRCYGFQKACSEFENGEDLWMRFNVVFTWLPFAAVVDGQAFCLHGGISQCMKSIEDIEDLERPIMDYTDNKLLEDLMWSDPTEARGFIPSNRGNGTLFGYLPLVDFLHSNSLKILVRGHQCVNDGVTKFHRGLGYTVFSSSNYTEFTGNACGMLIVQGEGKVNIVTMPPAGILARKDAQMSTNSGTVTENVKPIMTLQAAHMHGELIPVQKRRSYVADKISPGMAVAKRSSVVPTALVPLAGKKFIATPGDAKLRVLAPQGARIAVPRRLV